MGQVRDLTRREKIHDTIIHSYSPAVTDYSSKEGVLKYQLNDTAFTQKKAVDLSLANLYNANELVDIVSKVEVTRDALDQAKINTEFRKADQSLAFRVEDASKTADENFSIAVIDMTERKLAPVITLASKLTIEKDLATNEVVAI